MVAILTVFACHLWGWPSGGFVGVDVFFVISGFLITGNLLRTAETKGNVSFRQFYWNRVRRIVPAATVVLALTFVASVLVFLPFRSEQIGIDALFAFFFLSNWRFAVQDTDYFAQTDAVSPIQHYWSLSIEEQFYFIWPALIFVISLIVMRKAWTHRRRMLLTGSVMGGVIAASLGWAMWETSTAPTWAYFDTLARVWELGVGALLATMVGTLALIPPAVKPLLSWLGLGLIAASLFLIGENSIGFPAPWALLPVAGAALVIAAGVGGEPKQGFLQNPASTYVGDISYSLYLVHWPVIVIAASLMEPGPYFSICVLALAFGLAIASYHLIENPLRRADYSKFRRVIGEIADRHYQPLDATKYGAVAAAMLIVAGLSAYSLRPDAYRANVPPSLAAAAPVIHDSSTAEPTLGPLGSALRSEIADALEASEWPQLDPSMEAAIAGPIAPAEVWKCTLDDTPTQECTWGPSDAAIRVVVVGDSVAEAYSGPLREIALGSGAQIHLEVTPGCQFSDALIFNANDESVASCPGRKQRAVDFINATRPDVVIISGSYGYKRLAESDQQLTSKQWSDSVRKIVSKFQENVGKIVWMSAPPADVNISECYSRRSSLPADCISTVTRQWAQIAEADRDVAESVGGVWIDSRPWFCVNGLCPAFVGSTPMKRDMTHMTLAYAEKITPVIEETLRAAGII